MLVTPFSMIVAASTKSGKTILVRDIIEKHYWLFDKPLEEVIWCHHKNARDDELVNHLKENLSIPISFVEGFPTEDLAENRLFRCKQTALKCLVLDDVVASALKSQVFIDLFTIISHHQSVVVIAILQNLHSETPSRRQLMNGIIRNASYVVLFPDRRQITACKQIARTYFSGEEERLMTPFRELISRNEKYNYMLIDFENAKVCFNCLRPNESGFECQVR